MWLCLWAVVWHRAAAISCGRSMAWLQSNLPAYGSQLHDAAAMTAAVLLTFMHVFTTLPRVLSTVCGNFTIPEFQRAATQCWQQLQAQNCQPHDTRFQSNLCVCMALCMTSCRFQLRFCKAILALKADLERPRDAGTYTYICDSTAGTAQGRTGGCYVQHR